MRRGERNCEQSEIRYEDDRTFALSVSRLTDDRSDEPDMVLVIGDMFRNSRERLLDNW